MHLLEAAAADSQLSLLGVPGISCRMFTALPGRKKM